MEKSPLKEAAFELCRNAGLGQNQGGSGGERRRVLCSRVDLNPNLRALYSHGPDAWLWRNQEVTDVPGSTRMRRSVCVCV